MSAAKHKVANMQKPFSNTLITEQQLRKLYLFAELNDQQLAQIKQSICHIKLEDGEYLFKHGQRAERFFMVIDGHVKLLRLSADGAEKVFEIISPGQTFAEATMFMPNSAYPVTAQAINHSSLLCFENNVLMDILKESYGTCFQFMSHLSKNLYKWLNEIDNLTLQNATYRLINYLLYQVPDGHKNAYEIKIPIPKHIIASRLSMKPETLSRILRCLNEKELITVKGPTILIHNIDRLRLHFSVCNVASCPSLIRHK